MKFESVTSTMFSLAMRAWLSTPNGRVQAVEPRRAGRFRPRVVNLEGGDLDRRCEVGVYALAATIYLGYLLGRIDGWRRVHRGRAGLRRSPAVARACWPSASRCTSSTSASAASTA